MNEELKVKSFRISDETTEKFKNLCGDFDNQNTALAALISAYEMQASKSLLVNRQTEIEDYDVHIQALQKAFLQSLELNSNAEERIRTEFERQLSIKDKMIEDYQARIATLEQALTDTNDKCSTDVKNASDKLAEAIKDVSEANNKITHLTDELNASKSTVQDKLDIIEGLNARIPETEELKKQLKDKENELSTLKSQYTVEKTELNNNISKLNSDISFLSNEVEKLKATAEVTIEKHKVDITQAITETKSKYLDQIEQLRMEKDNLKDEIYNLKFDKKM